MNKWTVCCVSSSFTSSSGCCSLFIMKLQSLLDMEDPKVGGCSFSFQHITAHTSYAGRDRTVTAQGRELLPLRNMTFFVVDNPCYELLFPC
ncbi:hypothetical protein VIGAN_03154900 [Vigna angularis var. angularis]|uniref:Uncharacterized protein n=1 Tax=Vigna angularis var. angularis TaxID=157739 RepID=A0A0S3RMT7_PHAAN|nr:hypothetical protein VIGAN_03154900 [Vigna angularis var. angularis]